MKIGFSGLGQMGKPMALNLTRCCEQLLVNDIIDKHFSEFEKNGVKTTLAIKDFADCDIIFLCLPHSGIVNEILFGKGELASFLKPGQIVCDLSTSNYNDTLQIAEKLEKIGVEFMDAPVSGAEVKAIDGTLTIMCGGTQAIFDKLYPFFKCMGSNILFMGKTGAGQLTKTLNNVLYDINIAAFAEIFPLAVKLGLEAEKFGNVVNSSTGGSWASNFFVPRMLERKFAGTYPMTHAYKDLISCAEISAQHGVPLPVTHAATTTYQIAMLAENEDADKGAMIKVYEKLLNVEFKK